MSDNNDYSPDFKYTVLYSLWVFRLEAPLYSTTARPCFNEFRVNVPGYPSGNLDSIPRRASIHTGLHGAKGILPGTAVARTSGIPLDVVGRTSKGG